MNNLSENIIDTDYSEKKRPKFLNVLLVLSSVYIIATFFATTQTLISGPLTQEQLEEQTADLYGSASELTDRGVDNEITRMAEVMIDSSIYLNNEVFYLNNILRLFELILGAISIILIFKLRKIGFHLYLLYSLVPIAIMYITTPQELILTLSIVLLVGIGGLFSVLYGIHLKYMK